MAQYNYLREFLNGNLAFKAHLFCLTKFLTSSLVSVLEFAGMCLILRVYLFCILSVTATYGLFKYLRQNVEVLELTKEVVLNLARKYIS